MTLWSVLENEIGAAIRDWLQKKDRKKWEISADIDCVLEEFSRALLVFLHSVQCIRKCARNSLLNKKPQLIYLFFFQQPDSGLKPPVYSGFAHISGRRTIK